MCLPRDMTPVRGAVLARLEAEGFVRSAAEAPHPWHLVKAGSGRVSPADKAVCRSLTNEQRERIEANRVAALKRLSQHNVAALHGELSDNTMIAAIADQGAPGSKSGFSVRAIV